MPESGSQHIREMYRAEYATCEGITVAEIGRDYYGFSTAGMTPNEMILKMEQESYYLLIETIGGHSKPMHISAMSAVPIEWLRRLVPI